MTEKQSKTREPTPKQRLFAENIAAGVNPADAYRAAYGCEKSKPETVATEAKRLLANPHVAPLIAELRRAAANDAICTRTALLDRLEAVNRKAYDELTAEGATVSPAAFRAFMDTYGELKGSVIDDRWTSIANDEAQAQADDMFVMFDKRVWFK